MMKKFTPAIHDENNLTRIKHGKWKRGRKSRDPACICFLVITVVETVYVDVDSLKSDCQYGNTCTSVQNIHVRTSSQLN